jgi:7SK snRNA methylphosphate capping enzyme
MIFGNYHGYYTKRPFLRDPRLALLPPAFLRGKTVLDVGCNEGWVTCEIGHAWGAHRVVGVDIDDTLVRAAWRRRRTLWSLQSPPPQPHPAKRIRLDPDPDYFPMSCEQSHGPLPIPAPSDAFPHNVTFRTTDWVQDTPADDEYDVVIACGPFPCTLRPTDAPSASPSRNGSISTTATRASPRCSVVRTAR